MRGSLVVLGAGGHAKVVVATAIAGGFEVVRVLDDDERKWGSFVLGVPVEGPVEEMGRRGMAAVIAVGNNRLRQRLAALNFEWATVVHPSAVVHSSVALGRGSVIFSGAVIQPDARIGNHSIVNTGATIDHDCEIGSFVHLAPGVHLSGGVHVEEGVFMGIGSCAIPGTRIGSWTVVGAGGAVVRDLPPGVTAVGVPARPIPSRDKE